MKLSGFAQYPKIETTLLHPTSVNECAQLIKNHQLIARGNGQSYGDASLFSHVMGLNQLSGIIDFNQENSTITCLAGTTMRELLHFVIPNGLTVPVLPGSSLVTVGGAIAADVHGKNHFRLGSFSTHVHSFQILLGSGDVLEVSREKYHELFQATCGGMGLTGIILSAKIKLCPAKALRQTVTKKKSFRELFESFTTSSKSSYAYAWLDGFNFEHSLVISGQEVDLTPAPLKKSFSLDIPEMATRFLTDLSVNTFNTIYYATGSKEEREVSLERAHFPLEIVSGWNHLYGEAGMMQAQMVLPDAQAFDGYQEIFYLIRQTQEVPYLCSFRKLGEANKNLLSFPLEGFSLALDFKNSAETRALVMRLHEIIVRLKGKIYLAKDSLMTSGTFKSIYPEWEKFESIRAHYAALGKFRSAQSLRIGLA